jgi:murein DD-endopeptidase MepM/ murein hydrolase activator NlpD
MEANVLKGSKLIMFSFILLLAGWSPDIADAPLVPPAIWHIRARMDTWLLPEAGSLNRTSFADTCKIKEGTVVIAQGVLPVGPNRNLRVELASQTHIPAAPPEGGVRPFWSFQRYQNHASQCWLRTGFIPLDAVEITRIRADHLQKRLRSLQTKKPPTSSASKDLSPRGNPLDHPIPFQWPLTSNTVTSPFGDRLPTRHKGIDLLAPPGEPVLSSASGRVIGAQFVERYGKIVEIDHGRGWTTVYAHNHKILVTVGKRVKAGEVIAKSGNTGHTSGPHLHFEIRRNGIPVDPLRELNPKDANRARVATIY